MKLASIAALAALALGVATAQAAPVTYTISGAASGAFNGNAFTNAAFKFTLKGDTDDITTVDINEFLNPLASSTVVIDGFGPFTLLAPTALAHSTNNGEMLFTADLPGGTRALVLWMTASPISLGDAFGTVGSDPIVEIISNTFATSGGDLTFYDAYSDTPITFTSSITRTPDVDAAVPEPSTWAMMLMGFGGLGATLRRRRALACA